MKSKNLVHCLKRREPDPGYRVLHPLVAAHGNTISAGGDLSMIALARCNGIERLKDSRIDRVANLLLPSRVADKCGWSSAPASTL